MATKTATIKVIIPEPKGATTEAELKIDYDDSGDALIPIELEYIHAGTKGGPVMRPRKPRR